MSTLSVNNIEAAQGGVVNIPAGYSISVDGILINGNTLPPTPTGSNQGQALYVNSSGSLDFSTSGLDQQVFQKFLSKLLVVVVRLLVMENLVLLEDFQKN